MSAQPNPIIVEMTVESNDVVVPMTVATQYDLPIDLETLEADHNGDYDAPSGTAWDSAHVAVPGIEVEALSVTENGTTTAPTGKAYSPVTVDLFLLETSAMGLAYLYETPNGAAKPSPLPPKKIVINAPNCINITGILHQYLAANNYCVEVEEVVFTTLNYSANISASIAFYRNTSVKKIEFQNANGPINLYASYNFIYDAIELETVTGVLNFIGWTNNNYPPSLAAPKLKDIQLATDCIKYSARFSSPYLTDDSLVSIANALSDSVTAMTITHNATAKANCGLIVGTVTDGFFTQDAGGSVTLTDFITNVKGWTLA